MNTTDPGPCNCDPGFCARAAGIDYEGHCTPRQPNQRAALEERLDAQEAERIARLEAAAGEAPPDAGPQLVCRYPVGRCGVRTEAIVRPDSTEGRTSDAYWRALLPEASKGAPLSVVLWPRGWGREGDRHAIAFDGEDSAPPVAGSMPRRVRVQLPNGATRQATLMPASDGATFLLRPHPGDQQTGDAWEQVAPTKPKEPERGPVAVGVLARARARAAARRAGDE